MTNKLLTDEKLDELDDQVDRPFAFHTGPGLTKQSFKDEVNINNIMARWAAGSYVPEPRRSQPSYGDFSNATDYKEALDRINQARTEFMALPPALRGKFSNDPAELLAWLDNPENLDEAREVGLLGEDEYNALKPAESTNEETSLPSPASTEVGAKPPQHETPSATPSEAPK